MEDRIYRVLFETLTVAFCLVAVMWFRMEFYEWHDKRIPKGRRDERDRRWTWQFRNAWLLNIAFLFPRIVLIAPLWEELVFRAFLIVMFDRFDTIAIIAIVLSSLLFGGRHWKDRIAEDSVPENVDWMTFSRWSIIRLIFTTSTGLLLAFLAIWSGSLWVPVAVHAALNGFVFLVRHVTLIWARFRGRSHDARRLAIESRLKIVYEVYQWSCPV